MTAKTCSTCKGVGAIVTYSGMTETRSVCENCGGSGSIVPMTEAQIEAWIFAEPYEPKRDVLRELVERRNA